ncbi:MAG: hypothetical protein GWP61_16310 [Chloroflexi bacterium]|jgi:hypothetical protein|nr:hypothetical protein [Chloroflexota bacterium]
MYLKTATGLVIALVLATSCARIENKISQTYDSANQSVEATATPTHAQITGDVPLIPPFTPSYPCQLQSETVSMSDGQYCRSERIEETISAEGDGVIFVHQTHHNGYGCWSGINTYKYELAVCDLDSGQRKTLVDNITSQPIISSPDGEWFAFVATDDAALMQPHIYRVGNDGSDLQKLDTMGLPSFVVGARLVGWSLDGKWLQVELWNGSAGGWFGYRLQADASGRLESLP